MKSCHATHKNHHCEVQCNLNDIVDINNRCELVGLTIFHPLLPKVVDKVEINRYDRKNRPWCSHQEIVYARVLKGMKRDIFLFVIPGN